MDTRKGQVDETDKNKDDEPGLNGIGVDTTQDNINNQSNIQEHENNENEGVSDNDLDDTDENVLARGEGESVDEDDSDNNGSNNLSKEELRYL